jgi:hypothetical protein
MRNNFNPKAQMPWLAALVQAAQFGLAGHILIREPVGWLFGGLLGGLVSFAVAYASSQYAEVAEKRQPFVMGGIILTMALSPVIIGASMYIHLHPDLGQVARIVVGIAWAVVPDVAVALVGFTAGKGMAATTTKKADLANAAGGVLIATPKRKRNKKAQPGAQPNAQPVTDDALLRRMQTHPGENWTQLARHFGVSRTAITNRAKRLLSVEP